MTRWCALIMGVVCMVLFGISAVSLVKAERTGIAFYSANPRTSATQPVTRERFPHQFSLAISFQTVHLIVTGSLAVTALWFYRKLS